MPTARPWLGYIYPLQKRVELLASALLVEIAERCEFLGGMTNHLVDRAEWVLNAIRYPLLFEDALSHRVMSRAPCARTALISYVDAPRNTPMSEGRTVGDHINSMLQRIKQGVS